MSAEPYPYFEAVDWIGISLDECSMIKYNVKIHKKFISVECVQ